MNGAETSRVQGHGFNSQEPSAGGDQISTLADESKDSKNILQRPIRMVRKFPEDSEEVSVGHRQDFIPTSETTCICPEVLSKGTLVAIVGSLAFLGFFSTLVLLLVAIIVLRLVERQWKKEKEKKEKRERTETGPPKRRLPSVPLRPSEHVYLVPKTSTPYKPMHPVNQTAEGTYLDPKELHPGPRIRQEDKRMSLGEMGAETKSTPEGAYSNMQSTTHFSIPSPEHVYASIRRPENVYANVDEPQSMADASPAFEEQMKGPEEHFYEEIN